LVALGIPELLNLQREFRADDVDLVALQRMACLCSQHIKRAIGLHLAVDNKSLGKEATITILGKFLGLLGLKLQVLRSATNNKGKKTKVYGIDATTWADGREKIFAVWQQNIQFEPLPGGTPVVANAEAPELVEV
jgi:hypothetical protein